MVSYMCIDLHVCICRKIIVFHKPSTYRYNSTTSEYRPAVTTGLLPGAQGPPPPAGGGGGGGGGGGKKKLVVKFNHLLKYYVGFVKDL